MADISKRENAKGVKYQVRYLDKSKASGYSYKSFSTRKAAKAFVESGEINKSPSKFNTSVTTISQATDLWLNICEKEGRDGKDPVTPYTLSEYTRRAKVINSYHWHQPIQELKASHIVEFRSWLLKSGVSRYRAGVTMTALFGIFQELCIRDIIAANIVTNITVRTDSRYDQPVSVPSQDDVFALLSAADRLAESSNKRIANSWARYRPMLYLAADSGMRPQEYVAVAKAAFVDGGVHVTRAIERPGTRISVTKTKAGRRFIDLSPEVYEMVQNYIRRHSIDNRHDLVFPTSTGHWQCVDHWRKRGFNVACLEAGLVKLVEVDGETVPKNKFTPYSLRHYYASLLLKSYENNPANLKRAQYLMGHSKIETTLNLYTHLMDFDDVAASGRGGSLTRMKESQ